MIEHWQTFQKSQSVDNLPIDSVEFERRRRRQDGMCSIKSLVCCLSVLVGNPTTRNRKKDTQCQQRHIGRISNYDDDDNSFGYNFNEQIMSPRVLTRLADKGHHFD